MKILLRLTPVMALSRMDSGLLLSPA